MNWLRVKNCYVPKRKYLLILDDNGEIHLKDTHDVDGKRFYSYWIWPGAGAHIKFYCFITDVPEIEDE